MNILVIAANGRTGIEVVKFAKSRGHKVTSFIRKQENEHPELANTKIIRGDATNFDEVSKALKNQDVVISTIGHIKGSSANVQTATIQNIVNAAINENPKIKIVSLTGTGVRIAGDKITLVDYILNTGIRLIDPNRVKDGVDHFNVLKNNKLNWTIVRVLKLSTDDKVKPYKLTANGPTKNVVSRKEVAQVLVEVAEAKTWDRKLPIISND